MRYFSLILVVVVAALNAVAVPTAHSPSPDVRNSYTGAGGGANGGESTNSQDLGYGLLDVLSGQ